MKKIYISAFAILILICTACIAQESLPATVPALTSTALSPSTTPDLCASEYIESSIKTVNDLQREFDDASLLASNVAVEQLPPLITDMQRIRREAEDQSSPPCLTMLKSHQLAHMKTVIDTLVAFVSGAEAAALNNGIAQASQEHDLYTIELARLLGVSIPATDTAPPSATQTP